MKISEGFYVMLLLTIHAIIHGKCTSLIYGSTDIPCKDDNCLSILPPLTSSSTAQKTTSEDTQNSTPHPKSNESLNQSDQKVYFQNNSSITLACPRLGNYKQSYGKYRWTKIKPNVEILVLSEGAEPLRRTDLNLTVNKTHYVITIRNAKATDAGSYQCTVGESIIHTAHVFMIGT
ncbi:uncharacterized protein [Antedon mediterranea]|uniref:uncharacterized protein n=1 Tax=Antedon mediterranea TaxID=105859 RepID=UPI003AF74984